MRANATITPPQKYRSNPAGRVRHVARVVGVKLPRVRGRKPRFVGDPKDRDLVDRFIDEHRAHNDRNAFRLAVESVLSTAGCYVDRLTPRERRNLVTVAAQAFYAGVSK